MAEVADRYARCRPLFGEEFDALREAKVLLLGVGGVGSFCLDALYRTGVTDVTIVDGDRYDVTNQNRQIGSEAIGEPKVAVLSGRYPGVTPIFQHIDPLWVDNFDFSPYDVVLDAVDDFGVKVAVAKTCWRKLISSMGSAKRTDPTQIRAGKIWQTEQDPFARIFKRKLKLHRFEKNFPVIYSTEHVKCPEMGSFVGVTGAFGLALAAEAIRRLPTKVRARKEKQGG